MATNDVAGTTRTYYEFIDDVTEMTQLDIGAPIEIAMPNVGQGGGDRSFISGEMDVRIISKPVSVAGGERISFMIFQKPGTSAIPNVKFRLLYNNEGGPPITAATLSNPSVGSLSPGNQEVTGLTADGTTVYQVTWNAITGDGQANYSRQQRLPVVYT
jgi:hypothetical protein